MNDTVSEMILFQGNVMNLALQMYGCRVIQKALETVSPEKQMEILKEMEGQVIWACYWKLKKKFYSLEKRLFFHRTFLTDAISYRNLSMRPIHDVDERGFFQKSSKFFTKKNLRAWGRVMKNFLGFVYKFD